MTSPSGILFAGICYPILLAIVRRVEKLITPSSAPEHPAPTFIWSLYGIIIVIAGKLAADSVSSTGFVSQAAYASGVALLTIRSFINPVHFTQRFRQFHDLPIKLGKFTHIPPFLRNISRTLTHKASFPPGYVRTVTISCWGAGIVLGTIIMLRVIWGSPVPEVFISPDESNNRVGAELVATTRNPTMPLPFEDIEDLLHPRFWVSHGSTAISPHPPLIFYLNGYAMMTGPIGRWFPYFFAGVGLATISMLGILVSRKTPTAGAFLPLLVLPATYWVLRPWSSFSPYLTSAALASLFLLLNVRHRKIGWTILSLFFLTIASVMRPDHFFYLYTISFLAALLMSHHPWRKTAYLHLISAMGSILFTAWLNWQSTGDPLMSGYQLSARLTQLDSIRDTALLPVSTAIYALAPAGFSSFQEIALAISQYTFALGPSWLLILLAAGLAPYVVEKTQLRTRILLMIMLIVIAVFVSTRLGAARYGIGEEVAALAHDFPRYVSLIYFLTGIFLLVGLNSVHGIQRTIALIGFLTVIVSGWTHLHSGDLPGSLEGQLAYRVQMQQLSQNLSAPIPTKSVLYSRTLDKIFVSRDFIVGTIYPSAPTNELAKSMLRAKERGYQPFVTQLRPSESESLKLELKKYGQSLLQNPAATLFYLPIDGGG